MNLEEERRSAQDNHDRLAGNIPQRLSEREDKFSDQIKRSKINSGKKLESLYIFMNELYDYVSKYTPCKKGCSSAQARA